MGGRHDICADTIAKAIAIALQEQEQFQKQRQDQFQISEQDQETDQETTIRVLNGTIVLRDSGNSRAHTENESVVRAVFDQLLRNLTESQSSSFADSDSNADSASAADSDANPTSDSSTNIDIL